MEERTRNPYEDLIQSLLRCSDSDRWSLLRENADLIDLELIRIMEQIAQTLIREQNYQQGNRLHELAGQLFHLLTHDEDIPEESDHTYDDLIEGFLQDRLEQTLDSLPLEQPALVPKLIGRMQQLAEQLAEEGKLTIAKKLWSSSEEMSRQLFQQGWPIGKTWKSEGNGC